MMQFPQFLSSRKKNFCTRQVRKIKEKNEEKENEKITKIIENVLSLWQRKEVAEEQREKKRST